MRQEAAFQPRVRRLEVQMLNPESVTVLLSKLCTELGFCLPPDVCERLKMAPPDSIKAFTDAVVSAEGFNPKNMDLHLYRQVRNKIAEAFHQ